MLLDITEKEREFLERMCIRSEVFALKNLGRRPLDSDLESIRMLKIKLKKIDNV